MTPQDEDEQISTEVIAFQRRVITENVDVLQALEGVHDDSNKLEEIVSGEQHVVSPTAPN